MSIGLENLGSAIPSLFGQVSGTTNPNALAPLALRRWCGGLTLASPETVPSFFAIGAWVYGLTALLLLAVLIQGPRQAFKQLFGIPGHILLIREAYRRVRLASRLFILMIAVTVLTWTGSQAVSFGHGQTRQNYQNRAKDDLQLLSKSRSIAELGLEQGAFAAIVPLRDLVGLGSNLPLLITATLVLLRTSINQMAGRNDDYRVALLPKLSGWADLAWVFGGLFILYRLVLDGFGETDLPMGGCLMIESFIIPFGMLVCDGILLALLLVELRDGGSGIDPPGGDPCNTRSISELLLGAMFACLLIVPARYLATGAWLLASTYLPSSVATTALGAWLRWLFGRGLTDIQTGALVFCGIAGAVAWSRGSIKEAIAGYFRLLKKEGARLTFVLGLSGLVSAVCAAVIYPLVLSLPPTFWLINAADAYAHLATTAIGLYTLAAIISLSERTLPEAALPVRVTVRETVDAALIVEVEA